MAGATLPRSLTLPLPLPLLPQWLRPITAGFFVSSLIKAISLMPLYHELTICSKKVIAQEGEKIERFFKFL